MTEDHPGGRTSPGSADAGARRPQGWRGLLLISGLAATPLLFLVVLRYALTGRFSQGYLLWNLLLAAVPGFIGVLAAARVARIRVAEAPSRKAAAAWGVAGFLAWMAFYPNAPYIFTDFIHVISKANLGSPAAAWMSELDLLWYDIVMNSAFAFVGHYLGLVSMYVVHGMLRDLFGRVAGWTLLAPAMLLAGLGIHLGRFERFNSWDLVFNPFSALSAALDALADPASLLFSLVFAVFIGLTYLIFYLVKRGSLGPLDQA